MQVTDAEKVKQNFMTSASNLFGVPSGADFQGVLDKTMDEGKIASSAEKFAQTHEEFTAMLHGDSDPREIIGEIAAGGMQGYWSWQIKNLTSKLMQQVMGEMGVTEEGMAQMGDADRAKLEEEIMKKVKALMKEVVEKSMQEENQQKLAQNGTIDSNTAFLILNM